jgi:NitT/TauT family transport system substrate-binding protein
VTVRTLGPRRLALPSALAAAALALAGCASEEATADDGDSLGTVVVATSADDFTGGQLAYTMAVANGYFEEEGVRIENYITDTAPNTLQALINDQVNVGFLSLSTTAQAVEQGRNVKLAAAVQITNDWSLIVSTKWLEDQGIDPQEYATWSIEERGAVLGDNALWATNSAGGLWERASAYLADWLGYDPETDVQLAPLENINKIAGIKDGSVQVWLASSPDNRLLVESGDAVEALSSQELVEEVPLVANARAAETIVNDDWAQDNRELAEAFFRAYQRGADFVVENSVDDILAIAQEQYADFDVERIRTVVEVNKENLPPDSRHSEEAIQAQIDFAVASGNIAEPLPIDEVYTDEYLPSE